MCFGGFLDGTGGNGSVVGFCATGGAWGGADGF